MKKKPKTEFQKYKSLFAKMKPVKPSYENVPHNSKSNN